MTDEIREQLQKRLEYLDNEKIVIKSNTEELYQKIWSFIISQMDLKGISMTIYGELNKHGDCSLTIYCPSTEASQKVVSKINLKYLLGLFANDGITFRDIQDRDFNPDVYKGLEMRLEDFKTILQSKEQKEESEKPKSYF